MVQVLNLIIFVYLCCFHSMKTLSFLGRSLIEKPSARRSGDGHQWQMGLTWPPGVGWNDVKWWFLCRFSRLFWEVSWDQWCSLFLPEFFLWINIGWNWMIDDYGIYGSIIQLNNILIYNNGLSSQHSAMQNPSGSFTKKCRICPDDWWRAGIYGARSLPHEKKVVVKAIPHWLDSTTQSSALSWRHIISSFGKYVFMQREAMDNAAMETQEISPSQNGANFHCVFIVQYHASRFRMSKHHRLSVVQLSRAFHSWSLLSFAIENMVISNWYIYIYYYILIYWLISDVFCSLETTQFVPWTPNDKAGTACAKPHPSRILEDPLRCLAVCEMLVSGGSTCVGYVYVVWTEVDVDIQMVLGLEML